MKYFYLNGEFLKDSEARISLRDIAILRGFGIFDYFRTAHGRPFLIDDYLARFKNSAEALQLPLGYTLDELKQIVNNLLDMNQLPEAGIRLILTGGVSENAFLPAEPNFGVLIEDLRWPDPTHFQKGVKLITYNYQRTFPQIKSTNYLTAIALQERVRQAGAQDALYYSHKKISEATRSNFFLVKDKTLITPAEGVLYGVTRKKVLELSRPHYKVEERIVGLEELAQADECFLTGTTKKVTPAIQIDNLQIGDGRPGPVTRHLMKLFDDFELNYE